LNNLRIFVVEKLKGKTMSTISVTVEREDNALMLVEWLKNIRFVKTVNIEAATPAKKGNAGEIMKMAKEMRGKNFLAHIADPVEYQRQLRDEWER
jgi:hypothetical protein